MGFYICLLQFKGSTPPKWSGAFKGDTIWNLEYMRFCMCRDMSQCSSRHNFFCKFQYNSGGSYLYTYHYNLVDIPSRFGFLGHGR